MNTRMLPYSDLASAEAAATIAAGGCVAVPTETVYGLAADATDAGAVAGIYAAKGMLPLRDALPYLLGGAGGGVLAGLLFCKVPARALHLTLGALILLGGVRLLLC